MSEQQDRELLSRVHDGASALVEASKLKLLSDVVRLLRKIYRMLALILVVLIWIVVFLHPNE